MSEVVVKFLVRVPEGIWADIRAWAKEDRRSLNQQVVYILQRAVQEHRGGQYVELQEGPQADNVPSDS